MKIKLLVLSLSLVSSLCFANYPLDNINSCKDKYIKNRYISAINTSSHWGGYGAGFNLKTQDGIYDVWYGTPISDDNKDYAKNIYQTALIAYVLQQPVNLCATGARWLKGIELSGIDTSR